MAILNICISSVSVLYAITLDKLVLYEVIYMKRYIRVLALVLIVFLMFSVISVSASIKTDEKYFMDMFDDIDLT